MSSSSLSSQMLTCSCGKVKIEVVGLPILSAECHCESCQKAASMLAALPASTSVIQPNEGTPYVLYRKDRIHCRSGEEYLKEFRLTEKAPTRRVVAACCSTPLFLEFQNGHWLSLFASLWPKNLVPAMQLRTMTSDRKGKDPLPADLPNAKTQSASFMFKLLGAWIAMGFRTSKAPAPHADKLII